MNSTLGSYSKQKGAALFIALIVLIILALIGIAGMQATTQEEKMAGNMRDQILAFQAAESALRDAARWVTTGATTDHAFGDCKPPVCTADEAVWKLNDPDLLNGGDLSDINWWTSTTNTANTRSYSSTTIEGISTQPKYVVETVGQTDKDNINTGEGANDESGGTIYRVTARGTGGTDASQSILQIYFVRPKS